MLSKILYIMFLIILLLASVALTKFLMKKVKLNRWVIACAAPFVLIIPSFLFENMSATVWNILSVIFAVMCIMFFEITRTKLERNEIKGIVNYSDTDYKKKK
ncbi:hypothetical protein HMPREF1982_00565 [Clostridiales bacterium oral taxon 876 str. F0540]|nr:hypothetical protein HMPREF1982_00565 [Clostridiales bacterium oral taxon 876 str. F0540]